MQQRVDHQYRAYRVSHFDKMLQWVQGIPVPAWVTYLVLLALLILAFNALGWMAGLIPFGTFGLYRSSIPCYPIGSLLLIEYLNRVARLSLVTLGPALDVNDDEYHVMEQRLVTMPRWGVRAALLLSFIVAGIYMSNTAYLLQLLQQSRVLALIEGLSYLFAFGVMGVFFFHTVWQLRMVSQIHARIAHIDLFNRTPLYAFSRLSARTGIGLLLMNYFGIVTDPATFSNIALINVTVIAFILAILSFLLPLQGIYRRIVAEKRRLLQATSSRLSELVQQAYGVEINSLTDSLAGNAQELNSVATTYSIIDRIPTLPWEMSTLIGFASAVAIPFVSRLLIDTLVGLLV